MAQLLQRIADGAASITHTGAYNPEALTEAPLDLLELWNQLASTPDITSASYVPSPNNTTPEPAYIAVHTSQRDIQLDAKRDDLRYYKYSAATAAYESTPPTTQHDIVKWLVSPSGTKLLIIRSNSKHKGKEADARPVYWLDVYDNVTHRLLLSKSTNDAEHGRIITAGTFGGIQWHSSEQYIAYIAEPTPPKKVAFYDDGKEADGKLRGLSYEWSEEWGEQLGGVSNPRPYIFSLAYPPTIHAVDGIPLNVTATQVQFAPAGDASSKSLELLLTIFPHNNRRMGVTHYNTRQSYIAYLTVDVESKLREARSDWIKRKQAGQNSTNSNALAGESGNAQTGKASTTNRLINLTPDDWSAMCPRVSPDQQKVLYVTGYKSNSHFVAPTLKLLAWSTISSAISAASQGSSIASGSSRVVLDKVDQPASSQAFPGLYLGAGLLPEHAWLDDNDHIVLSSSWRSQTALLLISTATGQVTRVLPPAGHDVTASVALNDVYRSNVLIHVSTPVSPPTIYSGVVAGGASAAIKWTLVHAPALPLNTQVQKKLAGLLYSIETIEPSTLKEIGQFETVLVAPSRSTGSTLPPAIVYPHGGPSSVYGTEYSAGVAYLALCGFAVLLINFRGSTGFGENFLHSLPGRCGALDVLDCIDAANQLSGQGELKVPAVIDKDNMVVFGGSHGGFLSLHLIGQYPDLFKACCVRNPVASISAMSGLSDIPDWCLYYAGLQYDAATPPDLKSQATMFAASPIAHVTKVKTPTMMMLGGADRRCPIVQALDYARYLRANNVKNRIVLYKEGQHSLADSMGMIFDQLPNAVLWLSQRFYTVDDLQGDKVTPADLSIPYDKFE